MGWVLRIAFVMMVFMFSVWGIIRYVPLGSSQIVLMRDYCTDLMCLKKTHFNA